MDRNDMELRLIRNLYYDLARLSFDYDSGFDELINGTEIMNEESLHEDWLLNNLSAQSMSLFGEFRAGWLQLISTKPYSNIGVLMQIDKDWKLVVKEKLMPLIESIKKDLSKLDNGVPADYDVKIPDHNLDFDHLLKVVSYITEKAIKTDESINPFYCGK
ncbi:MAG: hypothetical protein J5I98_35920 [Phaeodactylibacter sp.]|nr:hypothetical protein [Phaeodactylibacter sp.]